MDRDRRLYKADSQGRSSHTGADCRAEDAKIFSPTYGEPPSVTMKEARLQGVV